MSNELNLRLGIEQAICRCLVKELIEQGLHPIWYGGDDELKDLGTCRSVAAMCDGKDGMFNYDEGHLLLYKKPKPVGSERKADYSVRIVFGNDGYDVISDYTSSLEKRMAKSLALSAACEEIPVEVFAKMAKSLKTKPIKE